MSDGITLLLDGSRGVYLPRDFAEGFDLTQWSDIDAEDAAILNVGPDHDLYWDAWDNVLSNAKHVDKNGKVWTLYQDGDLWAVCPDIMSNEDYANFFDEMKPAPDDAYEYEVCECCMIALANDDYSGMNDAEAKATSEGLAKLESQYRMVIPDGAEYGFRHYRCECCGSLPDNRYRVLCFDKKGE